MLSKPECGWSYFKLEGTSEYGLSYLDDIAFEWLDVAIYGLKTLLPFCVKGFLEPRRFLCIVSYWNCHIVIEGDKRGKLCKKEVEIEYSNTSMIEFCQFLYDDINNNFEEWVDFVCDAYDEDGLLEKKRSLLIEKLETLYNLILLRKEHFVDDRCFL